MQLIGIGQEANPSQDVEIRALARTSYVENGGLLLRRPEQVKVSHRFTITVW